MSVFEKPFQAVCFDCDSTLSRVEGIDELAARTGVLDEIAPMTRAAMEGGVPLDEIYGKRLALVKPDESSILWLAQRYIDEMVAGAAQTVSTLQRLGKSVHIISGGIRQAILPLADLLEIPHANVYAVDVRFTPDGNYETFDDQSPLITPGGKAVVCRDIVRAHGPTAMVGDGLTDIAARDAGAFVVGFGGVEYRQVVADGAHAFVDKPDLQAILDILLSTEEHAKLKG